MKTDHRTTLRHIAAVYLDTYANPRDLARPLTPEQVKDAGVLFLDLLAANEIDELLAREREAQPDLEPEPDFRQLAYQFIDKFRKGAGIQDQLSEDEMQKVADLFLHYAAERTL